MLTDMLIRIALAGILGGLIGDTAFYKFFYRLLQAELS